MGEDMNLETMKVADLKKLAKELKITGYSAMKKSDLIAMISDKRAEKPVEPAAEAAPEMTIAEEAPAEETAPEEPTAEEAPAEETAPEEPAAEEAPAEETAPEEPAAEEAPAEETAPEEVKAEETPAKKTTLEKQASAKEPAPAPVVLSPEMLAIKKEKRSLKALIAEAVSQGDRGKTKTLRNRKKEIRRQLKRKTG